MSTTRITYSDGAITRVESPAPAAQRLPGRVVLVDAAFAGLAPPAFDAPAAAALYARALCEDEGGRVLIRLYHGAGGEPLTSAGLDLPSLAADGVDVEQAGLPSSVQGSGVELLLTGSLDETAMTYTLDESRIGVLVQESLP